MVRMVRMQKPDPQNQAQTHEAKSKPSQSQPSRAQPPQEASGVSGARLAHRYSARKGAFWGAPTGEAQLGQV